MSYLRSEVPRSSESFDRLHVLYTYITNHSITSSQQLNYPPPSDRKRWPTILRYPPGMVYQRPSCIRGSRHHTATMLPRSTLDTRSYSLSTLSGQTVSSCEYLSHLTSLGWTDSRSDWADRTVIPSTRNMSFLSISTSSHSIFEATA